MTADPRSRSGRRRLALAALTVAVSLLHLELAEQISGLRLDGDAADAGPRRIDVSFVRELQPTEPPPVVAAAPPPRRRAVPPPPAPAASAPRAEPEPEPQPPPEPEAPPEPGAGPGEVVAGADAAAAPPPSAPLAEVPGPAASEATGAAESGAVAAVPAASAPLPGDAAASAVPFDWPPSTRLSYTLRGQYRGPLEGTASVEWLRSGTRYQVHLNVIVGPAFAPLISRRMSSDGELGEDGLHPRRYDEETRVAWREPRRATIRFEPDRVRLANDRVADPLPGLQDSASQFVQLTWLFTLQPQRLQPGGTVEMPLALPRRVGRWVYDVVGEELLDTPVGRVAAVKLQPQIRSARAGELTVEVWFAPTLQYLPVRLFIRQDAEAYMDLLLERLPQQAATEAPLPAPPPAAAQPP